MSDVLNGVLKIKCLADKKSDPAPQPDQINFHKLTKKRDAMMVHATSGDNSHGISVFIDENDAIAILEHINENFDLGYRLP